MFCPLDFLPSDAVTTLFRGEWRVMEDRKGENPLSLLILNQQAQNVFF